MTEHGFETVPAGPADFAEAAPRLAEAADGLCTALGRAVGDLEGHGPFWGADTEFARAYLHDYSETTDLAAVCARVLRAMVRQLGDAGVRRDGRE